MKNVMEITDKVPFNVGDIIYRFSREDKMIKEYKVTKISKTKDGGYESEAVRCDSNSRCEKMFFTHEYFMKELFLDKEKIVITEGGC